jgi:hypothetical protein
MRRAAAVQEQQRCVEAAELDLALQVSRAEQ